MMRTIFQIIYTMKLDFIVVVMFLVTIFWPFGKQLFVKKHVWVSMNRLGFIGITATILIVTLLFRSGEDVELILIPFHSFLEAKIQPEIYRSMLMNVFLFFPLGLTLPFALPVKWNRKAMCAIVFAFIFSFAIEFLQFYYHLGRAETDDVICNTLGAAIGTLSYTLERKFLNK